MLKRFRLFTIVIVALALLAVTAWTTSGSLAQGRQESANGHGTQLVLNEQGNTVRRQFSFSARTSRDGIVTGQAILRNPAFSGANGKTFQVKIEISCLNVTGNRAVIGGTVQRTNDPNITDSAFFVVEDNGEPGANSDMLSGVAFSSEVGPEACQTLDTSNFALFPIEAGNIQVTDGTSQLKNN